MTFVQTQISDLNKKVTSFNHLIATKESENGTLMQKIGQLADTVMEMHKLQFDLCQQFHIQCEVSHNCRSIFVSPSLNYYIVMK